MWNTKAFIANLFITIKSNNFIKFIFTYALRSFVAQCSWIYYAETTRNCVKMNCISFNFHTHNIRMPFTSAFLVGRSRSLTQTRKDWNREEGVREIATTTSDCAGLGTPHLFSYFHFASFILNFRAAKHIFALCFVLFSFPLCPLPPPCSFPSPSHPIFYSICILFLFYFNMTF